MDFPAALNVIAAALTPVVAVLAVYIAYRQYRTERQALKIALFGRRFDAYRATLKYVFARWQGDTVSPEIDRGFRAVAAEVSFLFGPDVCAAVEEVQRRGIEIEVASSMKRDCVVENELGYVYTIREHQRWFADAEPHVTAAFAKYLRVSGVR